MIGFHAEAYPYKYDQAKWNCCKVHVGNNRGHGVKKTGKTSANSKNETVQQSNLRLFVLGVTVTGSYGLETDQRVALGETLDLAGYELAFTDLRQVEGPNYTAVRAQMELRRGEKLIKTLYPEKRIYRVQQSPMTEAAIDDGWSRDVFVALGEDRVLLPEGSKTLKDKLRALGFTIYDPDLSMITQGGGGVHCMCQSLIRDPV